MGKKKRRGDGYERSYRNRITKTGQLITFGIRKEASEKISGIQTEVTRWMQ